MLGDSLNLFGGNGISETPGSGCLESRLGPETRPSKIMGWMCNMMVVFFSCFTSEFVVVSFRVGIPNWEVACPFLGRSLNTSIEKLRWGFTLIIRLLLSAFQLWRLSCPGSKKDPGPSTHWDGTIWQFTSKSQDPGPVSLSNSIWLFGLRCFLRVFANRCRPIWISLIWWGGPAGSAKDGLSLWQ